MTGRFCGCFGCTTDAKAVVHHPEHGERTVCDDHVENHEVLRYV